MNIAFVVPYVPNKIRTRPYNLIRHLAKAGHTVVVFTVGSGAREEADAAALQAECSKVYFQKLPSWRSALNCLAALPTRVPLQSIYSWDAELARQLTSVLKGINPRFDVVHVEHLRGSQYGRHVASHIPGIPVVWDSVDCISHLFEQAGRNGSTFFGRIVTQFELGRTRRAEAELIRFFDHVLTTSVVDKNALLGLPSANGKPSALSVLPGGVDLDYFHPNPDVQPEPDTLVFSGKMSYHANIAMASHLVREIMPRIWQKRPRVRLIIAGKDPSQSIIEFGENPLIEVTGTVMDIRPFLWGAAVAVVPLVYGAGIQNKIIEAMACGTPVVTNSRALSALHLTPDRDVLVGDDTDSFTAQILRLLETADLRTKVGRAGESYVRKHHNWIRITEQLVDIYKQAAEAKSKRKSIN
ncbi:MAG TPA: glycosyltransferase [Anaerolineales bacterium]|nr:glycosyltransferase [Anaerolineales bacterium]